MHTVPEQIDPRDLFILTNPTGLDAEELEKDRSGFVDVRTHSDYLIFLAGYEASAEASQIAQNPGHRDQVNAEDCKPEISIQPDSSLPGAGSVAHDLDKAEGDQPDLNIQPDSSTAAGSVAHGLDKAEGGTPDLNFILSALRSGRHPASAEVEAADRALKLAQVGLIEAVKTAYPIGSQVLVQAGQHTLQIEVTGHHSAWWSEPGYIHGKNIKTGKSRKFHHRDVIEAPNG